MIHTVVLALSVVFISDFCMFYDLLLIVYLEQPWFASTGDTLGVLKRV